MVLMNQPLFIPNPRTDRSEDGSRALSNNPKSMYVGISRININKTQHAVRARAFLGKRDSFLSKQIHKWDQDGEEEEEEEGGIEIILPEIVP